MAERRHISNETFQESQEAFANQDAFGRIKTAKDRLKSAGETLSAFRLGVGMNAIGWPIASIALRYYEIGSSWVPIGMATFGGFAVFSFIDEGKKLRNTRDDWKEILDRETKSSRAELVMEDPVLLDAVVESNLKASSPEEVMNLKLILNYFRKKEENKDSDEQKTKKPQTIDERVNYIEEEIKRMYSNSGVAIILSTTGVVIPSMGVGDIILEIFQAMACSDGSQ